jgi:hypothetical protein
LLILPVFISLLLMLAATTGCRSKTEEISSSDYLLPLLDRYWATARQAVKTDSTDLACFRAIEYNLRGRVQQSVEIYYAGPNKADIIEKLKALSAAYRQDLASRLDLFSVQVQLRPGVTREDFRQAFARVDEQYKQLEQLTRR